jgi:UDP-N-acetylglucosamine acyltransferase
VSSSRIHPTAIIAPGAELDDDVEVGPFCVIGADVTIGAGSRLAAHVVVDGPTSLGRNTAVSPFASIGGPPQDLKYQGEPTRLEIGDGNTIRESVTLNRGTVTGGGCTRIGSDNLFMAYAHVAHDCEVGSGVVLANAATLAGHVQIGDGAIIGGLVAVHQFCRVGTMAMLGGGSMVSLDVPPFCMAAGDRAKLHGLNLIGLRRRGILEDNVKKIRATYRLLFQSGLRLKEALLRIREENGDVAEVQTMVEFIENSERGICR